MSLQSILHSMRTSLLVLCGGALVAGGHHGTGAALPEHAIAGRLGPSRDSLVLASVKRVLDAALADSAFPGAIAIVGNRAGVTAQYAVGHLDWAPSPSPDEHTMWDIASLSKIVRVTTAIMQLVEKHRHDHK